MSSSGLVQRPVIRSPVRGEEHSQERDLSRVEFSLHKHKYPLAVRNTVCENEYVPSKHKASGPDILFQLGYS